MELERLKKDLWWSGHEQSPRDAAHQLPAGIWLAAYRGRWLSGLQARQLADVDGPAKGMAVDVEQAMIATVRIAPVERWCDWALTEGAPPVETRQRIVGCLARITHGDVYGFVEVRR